MQTKLRIIIMSAVILAGCSKPEKTEIDPVEHIRKYLSYRSATRSFNNNLWEDIQYDVQKTDSLVSPYIATISAKVSYFRDRDSLTSHNRADYEITLAFQDNGWVLKKLIESREISINDKWESVSNNKELHPDDVYWQHTVQELNVK